MSILNRSYARDKGRCWGPIYFPGEEYNFYLNALIQDVNFGSFRLDLVDQATGLLRYADIGISRAGALNGMEFQFVDAVNYNILGEFKIPLGAQIGWYKLAIWDLVDAKYKAYSNDILVEDPDMVDNTALLSYRHRTNRFGFDYERNPNWFNKVRYPLIHVGFQIEKEMKQYRNVSNRKLRNLKGFKDEIYRIQSYKFTEDGHKAISTIYDHDTIFLNNTSITPKTGYTIEENLRTVFTNGTIEVVANPDEAPPGNIAAQVRQFSDEWSDEFA